MIGLTYAASKGSSLQQFISLNRAQFYSCQWPRWLRAAVDKVTYFFLSDHSSYIHSIPLFLGLMFSEVSGGVGEIEAMPYMMNGN